MPLTYEVVNNCVYIYNHDKRVKVLCQADSPNKSFSELADDYIQAKYAKLVADKINEIKSCCEESIAAGFSCDVLGRGDLHYALTQCKQDDMKLLYQSITGTNAELVLWRNDNRTIREEYTAEQFLDLYKQALTYIISQKIYADGLEQCVKNYADNGNYDGVEGISFGDRIKL